MVSALSALAPVAMSIPSPSQGVWHLGPVPIRGYALCIVLGIILAVWLAERRWQARGGRAGEVQDLALVAVPCGIVGARLYHVLTDNQLYFGEDGVWYHMFFIWRGGLGIWGGIAAGALGAVLYCRHKGIKVLPMMDALAPAALLGQAVGRWGNWFNQELYGGPTDLPWGVQIDQAHFSDSYVQQLIDAGDPLPDTMTFHPTFLYECVWNLAALALILWLDRRFRIGHGRVLALYVMAYTLGRGWIEHLRIDDVQLNNVLGLRFNEWTSIVLFLAAAAFFLWSYRRHPGREESVYVDGRDLPAPTYAAATGAEDEGHVGSGSGVAAEGEVASRDADGDTGDPADNNSDGDGGTHGAAGADEQDKS
ncbi:prolipoprotein diacylglyceryl transferase [Nocardioides insulae]|uniref:prolipoprotein diacylglyceryl transferase n=1 Tax=Nocardioides insulae TaxID=394734 RepID=UPI00040D6FDA|nr:prolipoprotein diacylglyceryl transferase [Nocardioides insulae]